MNNPFPAIEQVRQALQLFQDYYTRRDPALVDEFLSLLVDDDLEVIGTNGIRPGESEWYLERAAARDIFVGDWEFWGDLRLDVPGARIRIHGKTAWLSASATVKKTIPAEQNYADFLARARQVIDNSGDSAETKLLYILRGGSNTLYELRSGEAFTWPLRFTAVLTEQDGAWKFQHMHFSFPTLYFPDARLDDLSR